MEEVTKVLPAIALRGTTILPDMIVHFDISIASSTARTDLGLLISKCTIISLSLIHI